MRRHTSALFAFVCLVVLYQSQARQWDSGKLLAELLDLEQRGGGEVVGDNGSPGQEGKGGQGRCPRPTGTGGICTSSCSTAPRLGDLPGCPRGQLCCRNGCGAYVCTRPETPGIPSSCPSGSPRIQCSVSPCSILRCPRFPSAVCRPTNQCEPDCTGIYFQRGGSRVSDRMCHLRRRPLPGP